MCDAQGQPCPSGWFKSTGTPGACEPTTTGEREEQEKAKREEEQKAAPSPAHTETTPALAPETHTETTPAPEPQHTETTPGTHEPSSSGEPCTTGAGGVNASSACVAHLEEQCHITPSGGPRLERLETEYQRETCRELELVRSQRGEG
jgi:hypothetical protein